MKKFIKKAFLKGRSWLSYLFAPSEEKIKFNINSIFDGHLRVAYRGVSFLKDPFDYVIYQMILSELRPDLVIEIGTRKGGGALYLADFMNIIGHGTVHTIDIEKDSDQLLANHPRIKLFTKGWENYDLNEARGFTKILVIDDGSHLFESTFGAMKKFSPLVSVGSYFIVEDGIINAKKQSMAFNGGPPKAIREFLKISPNFTVDRKWCDFFGKNATFNVRGYLKRVS